MLTKKIQPLPKKLVPTTPISPITTQPVISPSSAKSPTTIMMNKPVSNLPSQLKPNPPSIGNPVNPTATPQAGWGVGYGNSNVSGGFNEFSNLGGVKTEIDRMNTVMKNRQAQGLGNATQQGYLDKLNASYKPFNDQNLAQDQAKNAYNQYQNTNQTQQQGFRTGYEESQARQDATKWSNATIDDIAKKYGFDYSRNYAKQQAEAEAQALRNANQDAQRRNESNKKVGLSSIDNGLMDMAEGLDRNYFQQMMAQQQGQVNTGLNAGIASDQDLRLQMNRQAEMGSSYRDANLGRMKINENFSLDDIRLAEQMGLIDQQSLAREDSLYNDRLQQGFGNLMTEREMANARDQQEWSKMFSEVGRLDGLDQQMWGRSQADIDRAIQQQRYMTQDGQWQTEFDYGKGRDVIEDGQWNKQFDYGVKRDNIGDQQWNKQFEYGKSQDAIKNAQWQQQFNEDVRQFGLQYALQKQTAGGYGNDDDGSPSGNPSGNPSQTPLSKSYASYQSAKAKAPQTADDAHYMGRLNQLDKVYDTIAKAKGTNRATLPYSNDMSAKIARQRLLTAPTPVSKKLALFGL